MIPRTLAQNCGANVIRTMTKLRAKHSDPGNATFGIDGNTGEGRLAAVFFSRFLIRLQRQEYERSIPSDEGMF